MCPGDVVERLFYTVAGSGIVEHDFAITDVAMRVDLSANTKTKNEKPPKKSLLGGFLLLIGKNSIRERTAY